LASSFTFFFFFYSSAPSSAAGALSLLFALALFAPPSSWPSSPAAAGAFFLGLTDLRSAPPSSPSLFAGFFTFGFGAYLSGDSSSFSFSSTFLLSCLTLILSSRIFFFSFLLNSRCQSKITYIFFS
jgi:hypothetical protein